MCFLLFLCCFSLIIASYSGSTTEGVETHAINHAKLTQDRYLDHRPGPAEHVDSRLRGVGPLPPQPPLANAIHSRRRLPGTTPQLLRGQLRLDGHQRDREHRYGKVRRRQVAEDREWFYLRRRPHCGDTCDDIHSLIPNAY